MHDAYPVPDKAAMSNGMRGMSRFSEEAGGRYYNPLSETCLARVSSYIEWDARMFRFNEEADGRLLAGLYYNPLVDSCIVRVSSTGEVMGGVRYCDYQPGASVTVHIQTFHRSWLSRDFLWLATSFPFELLKVERVIASIPGDREKVLNLARRVGFKEICQVPYVYKGEMVHVLRLEKSDAVKWLQWKPKTIRPLYPALCGGQAQPPGGADAVML